jgi:hypothetical protein
MEQSFWNKEGFLRWKQFPRGHRCPASLLNTNVANYEKKFSRPASKAPQPSQRQKDRSNESFKTQKIRARLSAHYSALLRKGPLSPVLLPQSEADSEK